GAQELAIRLAATAETDAALEIYDGDGKKMMAVDEGQRGFAEQVEGLLLATGQTIYLRVRPSSRERERAPVAPGADRSYLLTVSQVPAPPGSEVEPNDTPERAVEVAAGDLSGTLTWKRDEDWFAVTLDVPDA